MPETPREYYILSYLTPFLDLNGVQEVGGSNPPAPIAESLSLQRLSAFSCLWVTCQSGMGRATFAMATAFSIGASGGKKEEVAGEGGVA